MKKAFTFIFVALFIVLITASRYNINNQSIENLAYVIAIGIDKGDNNLIKLTLQIATPSSGTSTSGNSEQTSNATTTTVECATINSGLNIINSYISKKLNLSHCKIVVFSEEFAVNGISDEVVCLTSNVEIRPGCSIAVSKCDAKDFIEITKPVLIKQTARFYDVVVNSGDYTGYSLNVPLSDFYKALHDDSYDSVAILAGINTPSTHAIPNDVNYIDIDTNYKEGQAFIENKNNMQINGLAVFHNGYLIGELNSMDSICHLILQNKLQNAIINIPNPFDNTSIINLALTQVSSPNIDVNLVNGAPYISCKINLKANIESLYTKSDFSTKENLKIISEYANSYIESHILDYLYKTSKELHADTIGFGKYMLSKFWTIEDFHNQNWGANYKNAFFKVAVSTDINNGNLIIKN